MRIPAGQPALTCLVTVTEPQLIRKPNCRRTPTSPTRFRNTEFSAASAQKFPLHFALDYFGGQFESEFFEEDLLVIGGF